MSRRASGNIYYYLPDALGSTMALVDSSGTVADSYNYDVFGAVRSSSGSQANPFTYTGERTDASTGLEYLRARYYDAAAGSFISRDPVATPNRYAYAAGNPVVFTDPSGPCVSQATHDKFMSAKNPFQAGEVHDWYQHIIEMWQNHPVCGGSGTAGSSSGGDGLHCGWTADCSNGRGCDSSVVDRPSDPHPDSCWHDTGPNQPSLASDPKNYGSPQPYKANCKGPLCKLKKLTSPNCIGFGIDLVALGVDFIPARKLTLKAGMKTFVGVQLDAAGMGLDAGTGDIRSVAFDVGTTLGGPIGTPVDVLAAVYSGGTCAGLW
jgi:RHS repeat-associated protein